MTLLSGARTSVLALAFVAGAGLPVAQATNPAPKNPRTKPATKPRRPVDPRVRESLARMGAFVKTLHEFSIDAETTKDEIVQNDYKVKKSRDRRPDRAQPRPTESERRGRRREPGILLRRQDSHHIQPGAEVVRDDGFASHDRRDARRGEGAL